MKKIRYGVFLVGGAWRLYREDRGVSRYNNRPDAISAAKSEPARRSMPARRSNSTFRTKAAFSSAPIPRPSLTSVALITLVLLSPWSSLARSPAELGRVFRPRTTSYFPACQRHGRWRIAPLTPPVRDDPLHPAFGIRGGSESRAAARASLGAALDEIHDVGLLKLVLRSAHRRPELIADFAKYAMQPLELNQLLEEATRRIADGMNVQHAKVLRFMPETADFLVVAGVGWKDEVVGHAHMRADMETPPGRAFQTGQVVLVDDLASSAEFRTSDLLGAHGIVSLVNVPLHVDGHTWGVLEADSALPRDFDMIDGDFLATFAGILGAAILRRTIEATAIEDAAKIAALAADRKLLLGELQHRLKNNLQIILSLVEMQKRKIADPQAAQAFGHIADRVAAIALASDQLTGEDGAGRVRINGYLQSLCAYIDPKRDGVQIRSRAEEIELSMDQAVPIGLIVNEAITNALKYAFPEDRPGRIEIELHLEPDGKTVQLRIVDDGVGLQGPRPNGEGRGLIQALAQQLSGKDRTEGGADGGTTSVGALPPTAPRGRPRPLHGRQATWSVADLIGRGMARCRSQETPSMTASQGLRFEQSISPRGEFASTQRSAPHLTQPLIDRLLLLGPLSEDAQTELRSLVDRARSYRAQSGFCFGERASGRLGVLLQGWAARAIYLKDGQRQIVSFLLPGDVIAPRSACSLIAITPIVCVDPSTVLVAEGPMQGESPRLSATPPRRSPTDCLSKSSGSAGCGRCSAPRICCWNSIRACAVVGLAGVEGFEWPITQEDLADALGVRQRPYHRTLAGAADRG